MCGRYVLASPPEEIAAYFAADAVGDRLDPNYNVAPTLDVYVVHEGAGAASEGVGPERRIDAFHWGLVPGFAKDLAIGNRMINARSETAATNGAFKHSLARRRCIVPADGFYEWRKVDGQRIKQPYFIHRVDDEPLAFAGLWAEWRGELAGERVVVRSTTILTTAANETMSRIHDRMPVILPAGAWDEWLDPTVQEVERVQGLLVPAPEGVLRMHPVSTEVNNARHEGPQLIAEIPPGEMVGAEQGEQQTLL